VATIVIIGLNVLAFLYELGLGRRGLEILALLFGVVAARYTVPHISEGFSAAQQFWPFITSMFLHGGWTHLIGNMWSFWIFGDNVEDRLGRTRFILLDVLGGCGGVVTVKRFYRRNPQDDVWLA
jgi:membrane associated rhomboid family serine protease